MKTNLSKDSNVLPEHLLLPRYLALVYRNGIPAKTGKWYLHWVKQFARYLNKIPLQNCSATDVKRFLDNLSKSSDIKTWQIEQARSSLRLLCRESLKLPWAKAPSPRHGSTVTLPSPAGTDDLIVICYQLKRRCRRKRFTLEGTGINYPCRLNKYSKSYRLKSAISITPYARSIHIFNGCGVLCNFIK